MINKIRYIDRSNLILFTTLYLGFVFLQLYLGDDSAESFVSVYGFIHIVLLTAFLGAFYICLNSTKEASLVIIFFYQFVLTLGLYFFYMFYYNDPFGPNPTDEIWYHSTALLSQSMTLPDMIRYVISVHGEGDIGFSFVLKYIYLLPGDDIFNMKVINVGFHMGATLLLYKVSQGLRMRTQTSKLLLIIFGLNPIAVYFNASGRKETVFIFVMVVALYFIYKAIRKHEIKYYVFAFVAILVTGLFRIPFPMMLLFSLFVYVFLAAGGKYKTVMRLALFLAVPILMGLIYFVFQEEINSIFSLNLAALAASRLGGEGSPSMVQYVILLISGVIGPIPSFNYATTLDSQMLQTVGNYVKIMLSGFFVLGVIRILKEKKKEYYPLIIFVGCNIIMITVVAATLDHRYHYPALPFYFIVMALGFEYKIKLKKIKYWLYLGFVLLLILGYNLR